MQNFIFPRGDSATAAAPTSRLRIGAFAVVGLMLFWLVLSRTLVAYLASPAPETALFLRSNDPSAAAAYADNELMSKKNKQDDTVNKSGGAATAPSELRTVLEAALPGDPLNAKLYRLLGQLAEAEHDDAKAALLMRAAAERSLHEIIAVDWMMRKSYENKDYQQAATFADALLRNNWQFLDYALPILSRMAENKDASEEVEKLLATNPPWRVLFFNRLVNNITDARTPLNLLLSLKDTPHPPSNGDTQAYYAFLLQNKLYELSYYTWLQFLSTDQLSRAGFLFNGDFGTKPSGPVFDWTLPQGEGYSIEIVPRTDDPENAALFIEFGQGRSKFIEASQLIMLSPGGYSFKGSFKGRIAAHRGMQWRVSCYGGAILGQSQMILGAHADWRGFDFSFTVPDSGCRPQFVQLALAARSASEQMVSGSIWFDDISITRTSADTDK